MKIAKKLWLIVLFFILIAFASWIALKSLKNASPKTELNVIIIGIDTCRQDHLSCYGYPLETTPNLDAFAKDSILFENALSQSPWTLPSFASLLTSCYPSVHGAKGKMQEHIFYRIRSGAPSGVEAIAKRGYRTNAIVNVPFLGAPFGFSRGFNDFDFNSGSNFEIRNADETIQSAINWVGQNSDKNFFLFIHLFDPHLNYDPPQEHLTRMLNLSGFHYEGILKSPFSQLSKIRDREITLSDDDWKFIKILYDAEISFVDESCGRFFRYLKEKGIYGRSVIVVMSDHGEEFRDHGGFEHGHTQYDELLLVPLIIKMPESMQAGSVLSTQVMVIDIMPTLLELLSIDSPQGFQGKSLMRLINGKRDDERKSVAFSEETMYGEELKSIRTGGHKLIAYPQFIKTELYDIEKDPKEKYDLSTVETEKVEELKTILLEIYKGNMELAKKLLEDSSVKIDKKTEEQLKSLGYIK